MMRKRPDAAAPPAGRAAIAQRLRRRLGPPPQREEWPPVSIVVINRDGEEHLRLLLPRLAAATDYPRLELILVDNASRDGSVELARSVPLPFPLTVVENDENLSFSDANDDGAERATFDRLLFLNNDAEPFEPGWLKELVACLEGSGAAAVGATLLHGDTYKGRARSEYVIQHRGVEFGVEAGGLVPLKSGDGDDLALWEPDDAETPALTAACLLVNRQAFDRVGGFTTGFQWGWEDVDLGLKLRSWGERLVCSGRSLLIHHESSTRWREDREWRRSTKAANQRLLMERWGPQLGREYLLDRFAARGFWTDAQPPRIAVVLAGGEAADRGVRELADGLEGQGWRTSLVEPGGNSWRELPVDADFVLITDPAFGVSLPSNAACIPWVEGETEGWTEAPLLRRAELTLVSELGVARDLEAAGVAPVLFSGAAEAERLIGMLHERAQHLRFCIKLSRDWRRAPAAMALRRSLEVHGHACCVQLADEWELVGGMSADVAIVCGDPGRFSPKPAQLNVLWPPDGIRPTECDAWDLVVVGDELTAASLAAETPTLVAALDLESAGEPAGPLLDLIAKTFARDGVRPSLLAHA
jgi:GT2 family glycosyltransferase